MPAHPERVRRHYGPCALCGWSTLTGDHFVETDDPKNIIVCRVPMLAHYPRYLGRISSEPPPVDAVARSPEVITD